MTLGIILVLMGLLSLFFEFFLPGGVLALIGCLLIFSGIVYFCASVSSAWAIFFFFIGTSIGIALTISSALFVLKRGRKARSFYQEDAQVGYLGADFDRSLLGKEGRAVTDFRPSGLLLVEGKRVQGVAKSGYIESGSRVKILSGEGAHYIIEVWNEE